MQKKKLKYLGIIIFVLIIVWANFGWDNYKKTILNLIAINIILGLGLNLINGFTGQLSLGHAGFMAIGAYTSAILTMSPETKKMNFYMVPMLPELVDIQWPFLPTLILAGILSAVVGFLIGAPVLRLRGDYLAIATLGFAEIIRIIITNIKPITNGALGLKGLPPYTNLWWSWGIAVLTIIFMYRLVNSSYGRALKSIREDEIAAQAMGISLFKHKMFAFVVGSFMAGVGGALHANLLQTVDPSMYRFSLTYQVLMIVVLGGMGSISGTIISASIVTVLMEALRIVESPLDLGFITIPGISGMRMVVFSILLMIVILFYQQGLMGSNELSWEFVADKFRRLKSRRKGEFK
ncbi:MAG TPA: branched-chain amino acid ABC transporter permease [Clostridia bacterium]|jgi:branched-chain amino acid transport system permease protein|nr:branched-chain amino acid ABC transporter permease [Clostridia bacterium]